MYTVKTLMKMTFIYSSSLCKYVSIMKGFNVGTTCQRPEDLFGITVHKSDSIGVLRHSMMSKMSSI